MDHRAFGALVWSFSHPLANKWQPKVYRFMEVLAGSLLLWVEFEFLDLGELARGSTGSASLRSQL